MLPEKIPGGAFGMLIIGAVNRLKDKAYGAEIARMLNAHGRDAPAPRVYQYLAALEKEGLLTSMTDETGEASVRGRPAKVYTLTQSARSLVDFMSAVSAPKKTA